MPLSSVLIHMPKHGLVGWPARADLTEPTTVSSEEEGLVAGYVDSVKLE